LAYVRESGRSRTKCRCTVLEALKRIAERLIAVTDISDWALRNTDLETYKSVSLWNTSAAF